MQYRPNRITLRPGSMPLYAAKLLRHELLCYIADRQPGHNRTASGMLEAATKFTGIKYGPGQYQSAAFDLLLVIKRAAQ